MTDNDIIKALDYCCGNIENNDEECNEDMCYQVTLPESREEGIRWCKQWLIKDALDLINRQKAEIKKLQKEKDSKLVMCIANDKDKIKSEAIKEFAERLCKGRVSNDPVVIAVQAELKDMDGGEE